MDKYQFWSRNVIVLVLTTHKLTVLRTRAHTLIGQASEMRAQVHVIHTRHLDILKKLGSRCCNHLSEICMVYNAWLCQPISGYTYAWVGRCSLPLACGSGTKRITWYCLMCGQGNMYSTSPGMCGEIYDWMVTYIPLACGWGTQRTTWYCVCAYGREGERRFVT